MATLLKEDNGGLIFKDGGSCSEAIKWNEDGSMKEVISHRPTVGCSMLVGSVTARSYSEQDYWLTTEVVEIFDETEEEVRFRTKNSIYVWRS